MSTMSNKQESKGNKFLGALILATGILVLIFSATIDSPGGFGGLVSAVVTRVAVNLVAGALIFIGQLVYLFSTE